MSHRFTALSICLMRCPTRLSFVVLGVIASFALGLSQVHAAALPVPNEVEQVQVGFGGKVVLGRWVPLTVTTSVPVQDGHMVVAELLDGDAVPVRYALQHESGTNKQSGLVRFGRATGITIRVTSKDGSEVIFEKRLSLEEVQANHSFLSGTTRLLLMLGPKNEQQVEPIVLKREQVDDFVVVDSPQSLPKLAQGFDSVQRMVILPIDGDFAKNIETEQANAVTEWVRLGGQIMLTGGRESTAFFGPECPLKDLLPGTLAAPQSTRESGTIELLTKSNDPLVKPDSAPLMISTIQADDPRTVQATMGDLPLFVRVAFGFGSITYCSVDFTSEPLNQWGARNELFSIALSAREAEENVGIATTSGRVSHIGYEDMAGQLRASLDRFKNVSFVTFTSVALLVALFILLIGPGDYFFLRKFTNGRMQITWLTFSLLAAAFCGLAWYLNSQSKSNEVELNQVEFIDVDAKDGLTRGITWAHLYSPDTSNYSVELSDQNQLTGAIKKQYLTWQGLPGGGLGSMQSRSELGLYRKPYENDSGLKELPLQNGATKTMVGRWQGKLNRAIRSNLRQSPTSDALLGSFSNPLDEQLYDCILLYGDWVYVLEGRALQPGDDLLVEDDMRETTVKGYFTRTGRSGGDQENAAWNPSNTRQSDILQMMGFFEAIGGESYTRLTNNFHSEIDLTHQLELGNAVLMGQIGKVTTPLKVNEQPFDRYDKKLTIVRIVFPVKSREAARN